MGLSKIQLLGAKTLSKIEIAVVLGLVFLVTSNAVRLILLANWIERLNEGLADDQRFQLIGWWTTAENVRALQRWKQIRGQNTD